MNELTEKQRRVYAFIRDTIEERHTPPTRAEIAEALGFASANAAQAHLRTLERKGFIELNARLSRGIRLTAAEDTPEPDTIASSHALNLAVIGRVAAGAPLLAVEHVERHCQVDATLFSRTPDYLLRVSGDSMTGIGIFDGDLLAVARASEVQTGQVAVFRVDDEVTVKRFARDGRRARLQAENPDYDDIVVDTERESLAVEGIAVGVIRSLH
ncbi:LexA repressor [Salinisphaera sp. T5B8]|uniref:transcriptional repressor LexA n=1 Tax=Salinisphaera sp. T5B8 TaxID=1304154 RepID=UPI0033413AB3